MTLDQWLSKLYQEDIRRSLAPTMSDFVTALGEDTALAAAAATKLTELQAMIAARGEQACAFSTKYRKYLTEALTP